MSFLLDPSFLSVGMWSIGAGALGAAALALLLANTDLFLSKPQRATLEYLEEIDLKTLEKEPRTFKAKELWEKKGAVIMAVRRPGCFLCREEAADLSSLKPKLDELGVPLYAVVKEQVRTEVKDFQPYFKGEIFLDEKKKFYGPQRRKMMFMGFVRLGVWSNFFRARSGGFSGNLEGVWAKNKASVSGFPGRGEREEKARKPAMGKGKGKGKGNGNGSHASQFTGEGVAAGA
ncbi:PREDICTED: redox-regulatory protein FAM213A [Myotis davidii]|uniref:redox-regulatory protein FAM213A n=1 Tax=Myotis davidii TaxID=225400 RepID=UPI000767B461|nr:PREDICTED: redox-regulatory protein FAM213A [Myotis davidii]